MADDMHVIQEPLNNKKQSIDKIFYLASRYASDLDSIYVNGSNGLTNLSSLTLEEYFDVVRKMPYQRDEEPIEIVARPKIIFERYLNGTGRDCKKAAVIIGAYCNKNGIPWRVAVVSTRPDKKIHHIFPQADLNGNGQYVNLDATYSNMRIAQPKDVTKVEYYRP